MGTSQQGKPLIVACHHVKEIGALKVMVARVAPDQARVQGIFEDLIVPYSAVKQWSRQNGFWES